jgi:hypothetical protein
MGYPKTLNHAKPKTTQYFDLMLSNAIAMIFVPFTHDSTFDNGSLNLSPVTLHLSRL